MTDVGPPGPILSVRELDIDFLVDGTWYPAARDVAFDLTAGEVLAVVGESGSGKTSVAMSLLGLLPRNGRATGSIELAGRQLVGARPTTLRQVRGNDVGVIFQEPMTALNPVYRIGFQIGEAIRSHRDVSPAQARERAIELLELVGLPDPAQRVDHYPHQLSGGQRQRAMIAQALACDPKVLVADEPTTALDVTVQAEILDLLRELRQRVDAAIVLITHDMGVVADMADRIVVMRDGVIVETGGAQEIFSRPQHDYTRALLDAVPRLGAGTPRAVRAPAVAAAVTLDDVSIEYSGRTRKADVRAVDGVSLTVGVGEVVGLVGESGSGKSTLGKAVVGLLPVTSGAVTVAGHDITKGRRRELRGLRSQVGMVFQDPGSSLNPRWPIGESIGEPLVLHRKLRGAQLETAVGELLDQVRLPRSVRNRYPHELSGGQRQRVGIARALALEPAVLVADEPTSALDVSVQASVLELFRELQRERGFACLFISHDLAVVEELADRVAVLRRGRLVEFGERDQVLRNPREEYTRRLLESVPVPDPAEQRRRRAARRGDDGAG